MIKNFAIAALFVLVTAAAGAAEDRGPPASATAPLAQAPAAAPERDPIAPENWSIHFQTTVVGQGYPGFPSSTQGPNSLPAHGQVRETISGTAFLGRRLPWEGGALYFNPEFNQGFGLARTLGVDGFRLRSSPASGWGQLASDST